MRSSGTSLPIDATGSLTSCGSTSSGHDEAGVPCHSHSVYILGWNHPWNRPVHAPLSTVKNHQLKELAKCARCDHPEQEHVIAEDGKFRCTMCMCYSYL